MRDSETQEIEALLGLTRIKHKYSKSRFSTIAVFSFPFTPAQARFRGFVSCASAAQRKGRGEILDPRSENVGDDGRGHRTI